MPELKTAATYSAERRAFLKEHAPHVLDGLEKSGELRSYLSSVGHQAEELLHSQLNRANDPEVQNLPFHDRVKKLASLHEQGEGLAQELVHELESPEPHEQTA